MAKNLTAANFIWIVIVAIAAIYLWGQFTTEGTGTCTQADVTDNKHDCTTVGQTYTKTEFNQDADLEGSTLWVIVLFIIGSAVVVAYLVVTKLSGGRVSRKDIFSLILLGVAVYFIWTYGILPSGIFGAHSFQELNLAHIGTKLAMKLGMA